MIWNEGGGSGIIVENSVQSELLIATTENPQATIETTSKLYFGDRTEETRVHVIKTKKKFNQNKKRFISSDSKEILQRENNIGLGVSLKNTTNQINLKNIKSWKNSKNSSRGSVRYHRSKLSSNQIKIDSKDNGNHRKEKQRRKIIDNKYNIDYDSSDDGKFEIFQTIEWLFYIYIFFYLLL